MNSNLASAPPNNIVFDLGGVLVQISHTWKAAAEFAGVVCGNLSDRDSEVAALEALDLYQSSAIGLDEYLELLSEFLGCSLEGALRVHDGILRSEYPGIPELISELNARGLHTGCLSNTNDAHWVVVTASPRFPAIQALQMKMASHLAGLNKPSHALFRLYEATFGVTPDTIAFFDDRAENVQAAVDCGWFARQIDPFGDPAAQLRKHLEELGVL